MNVLDGEWGINQVAVSSWMELIFSSVVEENKLLSCGGKCCLFRDDDTGNCLQNNDRGTVCRLRLFFCSPPVIKRFLTEIIKALPLHQMIEQSLLIRQLPAKASDGFACLGGSE